MFLAFLLSPRFILAFSAVLPAIWLLFYVGKYDKLDKEPSSLLLSLVLKGIFSTFIALVLEEIGTRILNATVPENTLEYWLLLYFVVVAVSEEGAKLYLLKKTTWRNKEFNTRYDGIVYAVSVSMGFALWENLIYVFRYGLSTALMRAFTAVPGHAAFAVSMGFWYGLGKLAENRGHRFLSSLCLLMAFVLPVTIHGAYDFIASASIGYTGTLLFILFILLLFLGARRTIRRTSRRDRFIQ